MNKSEIRKLTLHGMLLEAAYWFAFCTYGAFMVTTLIDFGWSSSGATALMTAMSVIVMLAQPVYGYICDNFLSEKKLSILLLTLAVVGLFLLPLSLGSGSKVLVIINLIGITMTGLQVASLMDAWLVGLKQECQSLNYGLMRGTGSLAYALSAQVMGAVTVAFGHGVRLWLGSGAFLLVIVAALTLRSARHSSQTEDSTEAPLQPLSGVQALKLTFASKQYRLLLGVSFFLLLSNIAMITLIQLCVRDFGGTTAQMGTGAAIAAVSEVPCMFLMAFIMKKVSYQKLFLFCGLTFVIRMFITASVATVDGLIYVQLLQGLTYAVLVPVSISYLSRIVDERVRSTAVTTYTAITGSLTAILGNLITSTFLAAGFSAQTALIFFAFSALLGFSLALYGSVRKIW